MKDGPAKASPTSRVTDQMTVTQALQRLFGTSGGPVSFTSVAQKEGVEAVLTGETPLVVVLPTGGGKTVLPMIAAIIDPEGVNILVTPFRALTNDMVARFQRAGISCCEWDTSTRDPATVLVVSADAAAGYSFLTYSQSLQQRGRLRRIFFDEAHLILTAGDWRPRLAQLRSLRVLSCPSIFLTATLPPMLQYEFEESMAIRQTRYIRASTVRPCQRYYVQSCRADHLASEAILLCRRWQLRLGPAKGIVYCSSRQSCQDLATAIACPAYHAQTDQREAVLQDWGRSGGLIVATSALGTGVDIPNVLAIIHIDLPWSTIDYAQETGRAGRGGEPVDLVVLVDTQQVRERLDQGSYALDRAAVADFVSTSQCRRWVLSEYLDGVGQGQRCQQVDQGAFCDRCGEGVSALMQQQHERALERGRLDVILDELTTGCALCWVLGEGAHVDGHRTIQCRRWLPLCAEELDHFRRRIRYGRDVHSCYRCGIDQSWCASGTDSTQACQWPFVLVPVVRCVVGSAVGRELIQRLGYSGEGTDLESYARWLGQRHPRPVCGIWTSNGMAVLVRIYRWLEVEV